MIAGQSWALWLCWLLAVFFICNGIVNIIGPKGIREGFARWGFPSWFHIANGLLDLVAGVLIALPQTRPFGLGLGILICLGVFATLIRHRELAHLPPSVVLFVVVAVAGWGSGAF